MTPAQILVELWPKIHALCPDIRFKLIPFENTPENAREILKNLGKNIDMVAEIFDETLLDYRQCSGCGGDRAVRIGCDQLPEEEVPGMEATSSPFPSVGKAVPMEDFLRLAKVPIVVYFGDNIPSEPTDNWGQDNWRVRLNLSRKW